MERRQLEYFVAVADHGSFTAAAASLYVAQPSLSQAVRALERELGADLFFRLHRGVKLTAAGQALLTPARQTVRDLNTGRAAVQAVIGLSSGRLDLAMLPALTLDPLAPMLGRFRARFPDVQIFITQPEEIRLVHSLVRSGQVELGFLDQHGDYRLEDLEAEVLSTQDLVAVFPPETRLPARQPVGWEDLLDHGLIAGTRGTLVRDQIEAWAAENDRTVSLAIEVGRRETGMYLVLAGAGVAAFPTPLASLAEALGAVVRPLRHSIPRKISMCWRPGPLSPAADAFRSIVRELPAR